MTTLPGKVIEATPGMRGFDANQHISVLAASQFRMKGYRFAVRYVPRVKAVASDLTMSEASGILGAGLGLMIVQHVHSEGWVPSKQLGIAYGTVAARSAVDVGYKLGGMLWLDLEGEALGNYAEATVAFCNFWLDQVGRAGFTPGVYVGWHAGLTADQLYSRLRFSHYWGAYNLDVDKRPAVRGLQMKQATEQVLDGVRFDPDTVRRDALGGLPLMHVDNEFTP